PAGHHRDCHPGSRTERPGIRYSDAEDSGTRSLQAPLALEKRIVRPGRQMRHRVSLRVQDERVALEPGDRWLRRHTIRDAQNDEVGVKHHAQLSQSQAVADEGLGAETNIRPEPRDHLIGHIIRLRGYYHRTNSE